MNNIVVKNVEIKNMIYEINGRQVMIDSDLAFLFKVPTRAINQAVSRNLSKVPKEFSFKLSDKEQKIFWSQFVIKNKTYETRGGKYKNPRVFTEQGIIMLASILKSNVAIEMSIAIVNAFVEMRKFISNNAEVFNRLTKLEYGYLEHDTKINQILDEMNPKEFKGKVFCDGQIYDAYSLLINIIREAKSEIIIIDNYIDKTILDILLYKNENVKVQIWTKNIKTKLDIDKFNLQYPNVSIKQANNFHDRFIIIDNKILYLVGASLKDLGKKSFGIVKMDKEYIEIIKNKIN